MNNSSFLDRLILGGVFFIEDSPEDQSGLKTYIQYRLLTYYEFLLISSGSRFNTIINTIQSIHHFEWQGTYYEKTTDKKLIKELLSILDQEIFEELINQIIEDSRLNNYEYRKVEYLTYYLNWKADSLSRRMSYNCEKCKKFNYLNSRFCFLEEEEITIPDIRIIDQGTGSRIEVVGEIKVDIDGFFEVLTKLAEKEPNLPIFEVGLKYFSGIIDTDHPDKKFEVCPEAIKIKSLDFAEILEMENRAQEYGILPFGESQIKQPNLLIDLFDGIRIGRSLFHSKKMEEIQRKAKNENS